MKNERTILDLGSDLSIRYRWFVRASLAHPAKLHLGVLQWILDRYTRPGDTVADPMAGVGSILYAAAQQRNVIAREIEPRWLAFAHQNAAEIINSAGLFAGTIDLGQADAREPWGFAADHIIFSPPYGCESKRDPERRGRVLTERLLRLGRTRVHYSKRWELLACHGDTQAGAGALFNFAYGSHSAQIGHLRDAAYWEAMEAIYRNARAALRGGVMALVIKDHIKKGVRVRVADRTVELCHTLGFTLIERTARRVYPLSLWQRRRKEQGKLIVENEDILVFQEQR